MSLILKNFMSNHIPFLDFKHILWEASKPIIVFKDNKSVERFSQTKIFQIFQITSLWNGCEYFLQFTFKVANIAGSVDTAADFFSRLKFKVMQKIRLKIREVVQTIANEVTTSSQDVVDEENFFFTKTDWEEDETG